MRILIGHTNQIPELNQYRALPGRENKFDDVLAFGNGYAQVLYTEGMTWEELLAQCPPGWKPDVYVHWSPEYNLTPPGLENAECYTIGVFGDWNLGGLALRNAGDVFDLLVADKEGCKALNAAGFTNTMSALLWGYDPAIHRKLPDFTPEQKDIDLLMIGNFNHAVQSERSRWLARVAKLSQKYHVVLTSGVIGDAYTEAMNRAKIVFNRSVAGGVNMRVYETLACNSLLLYERGNPEIETLFTDKEHLVLYGEDDFEAIVDHYLNPQNAPEREQITNAGHRAVAPYSYAHQLSRFFSEIEPLVMAHKRTRNAVHSRAILHDEEGELRLLTLQTYLSSPHSFARVEANLYAAKLTDAPSSGTATKTAKTDVLALRSVLASKEGYAMQSPYRDSCFHSAVTLCQKVLLAEPDHIATLINLAGLQLALNRTEEGENALLTALSSLESPPLTSHQLRGLVFSSSYGSFDVERERIWLDHAPGSPEWTEETRILLTHRVSVALGEIASSRQDFETSCAFLEKALSYRPRSGETAYGYACSLRTSGKPEKALIAYALAIENSPFHFDAWQDRAALLLEMERVEEASQSLDEFLVILAACPVYAEANAYFKELREKIAPAAQRQAATQSSQITRLIALPDWNEPAQWQPLLQSYVGHYSVNDPVILLLPIPPDQYPDPAPIVQRMSDFLTETLGVSLEKIPKVTLLTEPIESMIRAHALPIVDAVLAVNGAADAEFAQFLGVPLLQTHRKVLSIKC